MGDGEGREWRRGEYLISTDPGRIDLATVHAFLARSYWAAGIPLAVVRRSIAGSLSFGLYHAPDGAGEERQAGFGRVVTDRATFAWIADVFVVEAHRGRGVGKWLIETMLAHPDLQGVRGWRLATRDAHDLYRPFGFAPLAAPERYMERRIPNPHNV